MDPVPLNDVAAMAGAKIVSGDPATVITGVSKDTRTLQAGDLYLALRGENFDGNAFAAQALASGASAVLVDDPAVALPEGSPVLLAASGLDALSSMARAWRSRLNLRAICITGSNGKTSTKEFTAAVLGTRYTVVKTVGNLNNHIGVPLSILSASTADTAAVWEIGMNHAGEIAPLAALARPDGAIITNIGVAHIENLGSRDAIAQEKGMLAEAVAAGGFVVLPAEDDYAASLSARTKARVVMTGLSAGAVTADSISESAESCEFVVYFEGRSLPARLPCNGTHMVRNALLAIAGGIELGIPVEQAIEGLAASRLAAGRLQHRLIRGIGFLDDTYNANPDSMVAALSTLRALPGAGRRIAVLGRMGELGDYALTGYQRTGEAAAQHADILITVGAETAPMADAARAAGMRRIHEVADTASASLMLENLARKGDTVLVKGSRSARMETVIQLFDR